MILYYLITTVYYLPAPITVEIAPSASGRALSVTSADDVMVIQFVLSAKPHAFEAAEASSPVRLPNAM